MTNKERTQRTDRNLVPKAIVLYLLSHEQLQRLDNEEAKSIIISIVINKFMKVGGIAVVVTH